MAKHRSHFGTIRPLEIIHLPNNQGAFYLTEYANSPVYGNLYPFGYLRRGQEKAIRGELVFTSKGFIFRPLTSKKESIYVRSRQS